jgi:hypothetical protein
LLALVRKAAIMIRSHIMVPLWFMPAGAVLFVAGASAVAALRRLGRQRMGRDGLTAFAAATASLLAAIGCYSIPAVSSNAGALCFLLYPAAAALVLKIAARRFGFRPGSLVAAVCMSALAALLIAAWTILYLKGPRGGWSPGEIVVFSSSAILTNSAAACLGWWSSRHLQRAYA